MVQGAALPVPEDPRERDDAGFACGQELLAGEFRRGVEEKLRSFAVRRHRLGGEGVQMRLVAGGDLERGGLDLDEVRRREEAAQGGLDAVAADQEAAPIGMDVGRPPGRGFRHRGFVLRLVRRFDRRRLANFRQMG